jgi:hypothetical protein
MSRAALELVRVLALVPPDIAALVALLALITWGRV